MQFLTVTWNVDPELITIGILHVRYYGVFFVLAFIVSYRLFLHMFRREKLPASLLENLTVIVAVSTFVGARLGHCLFYQPGYFLAHPIEMILPVRLSPHFEFTGYQGLASHGAAIGILIGLWYFSRKYKKSLIWVLDRISIAIPVAGSLVRIGNLMNSEIYGDVTGVPWGFIFVRAGETLPHHPTQLYEAAAYLTLFFLLYYLYRRKLPTLRRGTLFGVFLIGLFSARFLIEFIKEPQVGFEEHMFLNMGQWLSVPFILAGVVMLTFVFSRKTPARSGR
jgi:prolipoprotein diacylglyceryl transferase